MDCRIPRRVDNVIEKQLDDGMILVNANTNEVLSPSESGQAIWGLIDNHRTVEEIVTQICLDYDIQACDSVEDEDGDVAPDTPGEVLQAEPGTVQDQVRSFVELLASRGLVTFAA